MLNHVDEVELEVADAEFDHSQAAEFQSPDNVPETFAVRNQSV
jgi:hypothetical protein